MSTSDQSYTRFDRENQYSASHWSQRRVKTFRLQQLPTGQVSVLCAPRAPQAKRRHSFDMGQLSRNGCGQLNQEINYYLPPLHFTRNLSTPGVNGGRHTRPFSASNERAKKGFKFWIDDKTKSSSGVKTMGSRGSFLGLGVPRL